MHLHKDLCDKVYKIQMKVNKSMSRFKTVSVLWSSQIQTNHDCINYWHYVLKKNRGVLTGKFFIKKQVITLFEYLDHQQNISHQKIFISINNRMHVKIKMERPGIPNSTIKVNMQVYMQESSISNRPVWLCIQWAIQISNKNHSLSEATGGFLIVLFVSI